METYLGLMESHLKSNFEKCERTTAVILEKRQNEL